MGMIYKQKDSGNFWIKFYRNGRPIRESTRTKKESEAKRILRSREGDVVKGLPVVPRMGRVSIDELIKDVENDYKANGKDSLQKLEGISKNHLIPFFGGRPASFITTADVQEFIVMRQ